MRWLDGITNSVSTSLSKLQAIDGKFHEQRTPGVTVQMVTESDTTEHENDKMKGYPLEFHYFLSNSLLPTFIYHFI